MNIRLLCALVQHLMFEGVRLSERACVVQHVPVRMLLLGENMTNEYGQVHMKYLL